MNEFDQRLQAIQTREDFINELRRGLNHALQCIDQNDDYNLNDELFWLAELVVNSPHSLHEQQ